MVYKIFFSVLIAWLVSALLKGLFSYFKNKKFSLIYFFRNGGMPSSHSAVVSSVTTSIFLFEGLSSLFFVAFFFSCIIIVDAVTVRREVGLQGDSLNRLLKEFKHRPISVVYGHTAIQVLIGIIIGVVCSYIVFL